MCAPYNIICAWALFVVAIMVGLPSLGGLYKPREIWWCWRLCHWNYCCLFARGSTNSFAFVYTLCACKLPRAEWSSNSTRGERDTGSPFNYVDLPQSYACRKSTAQQREREFTRDTHKTQTERRCVLSGKHTHTSRWVCCYSFVCVDA